MKSEQDYYTPLLTRPHYLYRCYDTDGRLLYIGCTIDPFKRYREHMLRHVNNRVSHYLQDHMTRFEVEPVPHIGIKAGHAAETAAIKAETPLLNALHNRVPAATSTKQETFA